MFSVQNIVFMAIIVICWGGWPLVGKASGLPSHWLAVIASCSASIVALFGFSYKLGSFPQDVSAVATAVATGIMMGAGMVFYSIFLTDPSVKASIFVPAITGLIAVATFIGGLIFFKDVLTWYKLAGIILIFVGVFLLNK